MYINQTTKYKHYTQLEEIQTIKERTIMYLYLNIRRIKNKLHDLEAI